MYIKSTGKSICRNKLKRIAREAPVSTFYTGDDTPQPRWEHFHHMDSSLGAPPVQGYAEEHMSSTDGNFLALAS